MVADTIFALSSGAGMAGVAVVRISGPAAGDTLAAMAGSVPESRRAVVRHIRHPVSGELLDRAMVLWFRAPASATGEDVGEFHLHGSPAVVSGVLAALGAMPGLRMAEPGEFTRRALANQKVDLVEVEGLADLLAARSSRQRQQALHHLIGEASGVYEDWRQRLLKVLARVEAAVDFVEEEGVADAAIKDVDRDCASLAIEMESALAAVGRAQSVREGLKVVLAGMPNTGKSSLLNRLARRDAAIVSSRPGTTRDVIEVAMEIGGMAVILTDTAGLRGGSEDEIELIGMARSRREMARADVAIWVGSHDIPGSLAVPADLRVDMRVTNKIDVEPGSYRGNGDYGVSALSGDGVEALVDGLSRLIAERYGQTEAPVIVRERQSQAISESIRYLNDSRRHGSEDLELMAEDLRKAAHALARVTGRIEVEELLSAIFSEFCIGK